GSLELAAAAEPRAHLRARVETITRRDEAYTSGGGSEHPRAVPSIEPCAKLPTDRAARPVRDVELKRVVNRRREDGAEWLSLARRAKRPDTAPRGTRGKR